MCTWVYETHKCECDQWPLCAHPRESHDTNSGSGSASEQPNPCMNLTDSIEELFEQCAAAKARGRDCEGSEKEPVFIEDYACRVKGKGRCHYCSNQAQTLNTWRVVVDIQVMGRPKL
ncbi:hypothetical protein LTR36_003343 [Oleoguttula mirabilis]|uniref:Uncharacterized protein n=1 Tax=Oleoguttula mirabilis TaxID=1507867 RepID=A0AAV9JZB2_9PEZI|nr:hypothetical protein LTR36_003343 [Oleoguttula mirabilis]